MVFEYIIIYKINFNIFFNSETIRKYFHVKFILNIYLHETISSDERSSIVNVDAFEVEPHLTSIMSSISHYLGSDFSPKAHQTPDSYHPYFFLLHNTIFGSIREKLYVLHYSSGPVSALYVGASVVSYKCGSIFARLTRNRNICPQGFT